MTLAEVKERQRLRRGRVKRAAHGIRVASGVSLVTRQMPGRASRRVCGGGAERSGAQVKRACARREVIGPHGPGGWVEGPRSLGSWAMAHNPHAPQPGPEGTHDPAGSTQMFRAFVDEGEPQRRQQPAATSSGPKTGVIVAVVAVIVVLGAVAWLALG